jgi:hypothetical protein
VDSEHDQLRDAFMAREIHPEVFERVSWAVKSAAERGEQELMVLRCSSEYCTDDGRAINSIEPDWPNTLTGFAKRAYEFWQKELEPHRYKLRAQIVDFPAACGRRRYVLGVVRHWAVRRRSSHSELQGVACQDRFMLRCSKKP